MRLRRSTGYPVSTLLAFETRASWRSGWTARASAGWGAAAAAVRLPAAHVSRDAAVAGHRGGRGSSWRGASCTAGRPSRSPGRGALAQVFPSEYWGTHMPMSDQESTSSVFVDPSGRRRRTIVAVLVGLAVLGLGYLALVLLSVFGVPLAPIAKLPLPPGVEPHIGTSETARPSAPPSGSTGPSPAVQGPSATAAVTGTAARTVTVAPGSPGAPTTGPSPAVPPPPAPPPPPPPPPATTLPPTSAATTAAATTAAATTAAPTAAPTAGEAATSAPGAG